MAVRLLIISTVSAQWQVYIQAEAITNAAENLGQFYVRIDNGIWCISAVTLFSTVQVLNHDAV